MIRFTKKRKRILEVLKRHHGTLSAAEIHARVPEVDLVTVYRNLDLFVQEGFITEVHLGTDEAQYEYQDTPHHHAVCTDCNRVIHFSAPNEKIKRALCLSGFSIDSIEVTVHGTCTGKHA